MELWVQHNDVLFQPIELGSAIGGQACFRDLQGSVELQKLYAISTQSVPTAQRVNGRTDPCKSEEEWRESWGTGLGCVLIICALELLNHPSESRLV